MTISAADALAALRQRWWVLILAAAIAATAAFAYTRAPWVEPRWRSSVWIQAAGRFDYGNALALERQLRPLAERLRQLSIMREVEQRLHLDLAPEHILGLTRAEPIQDSNQIRVEVEDAAPARAQAMALEIATVYAERHNASQQGTVRSEQVLLTVLERDSGATLIWPQTRVIVPTAALFGLLAAAATLLLLAYLDDTLKSANDVRRTLDLPVIGLIPRHRGSQQRRRSVLLHASSVENPPRTSDTTASSAGAAPGTRTS